MTKYNFRLSIAFVAFFSFSSAQAVTLIETRQADGSSEKIYIDGMKVRIDSSAEPGYVIIDGAKGTMHVVSHEEKQIMDMGSMLNNGNSGKKTKYKIKFIKKGKGPKIAGYTTMHYQVQVDGKKCSDEYVSKKMPQELGIQKTFDRISSMLSGPDMDGMPGMDPCMMAEQQLSAQYSQYGYPMRTKDASGALESEVIKTSKNAPLPKGGFSLPKGYQVVTMGQMMQQMGEQMGEQMGQQMQGMDQEQVEQMQQMMEQMMQQMGKPPKE